jgi:uncharacterized membrane protein
MIEIIPNWHPLFVHFTIGLLMTSAVLFAAATYVGETWRKPLTQAAQINLWIGGGFTLLTLVAGWYAFRTVNHDGHSHLAMLDHRSWALLTAGLFLFLSVWSWIHRKEKTPMLFVVLMLMGAGLLVITGYKGGELVYRHGLGVMALPAVEHSGHEHHHHENEEGEHAE